MGAAATRTGTAGAASAGAGVVLAGAIEMGMSAARSTALSAAQVSYRDINEGLC
jgi:NAD(P)H-hydrate repair Nnr-like enzyme with NAD(P)H-hydrate dehydratase domain